MKTSSIFLTLIGLVLLSAIVFQACKKDKDENDSTSIVYTNGQGEIDSKGGTIKIGDEDSPIYGTYITIPENALANKTLIKIELAPDSIVLPGDSSALVIRILPEGLKFTSPVEIGFHYGVETDTSKLQAYYINPDSLLVSQLPTIGIDNDNKIFKASTNHFSYFAIGEDGVHVNVDLYHVNNRITANVYFDGYWAGNNLGLAGVQTVLALMLQGVNNAKQFVDEYSFFLSDNDDVYSTIECNLKKKVGWWGVTLETVRISVHRTGLQSSDFGAEVYCYNETGSKSVLTNPTYYDALQNSAERESFFNGKALIFHFNTIPNPDEDYYIEARWNINSMLNTFWFPQINRAIEVYEANSYDYSQTLNQMLTNNRDLNNNSVIDSYEENSNSTPIAAFTANPTSGTPPLTVNFTDQSTNTPTSWQWDFGDGSTSTLKNPSHTYSQVGLYSVQLTASNAQGSDTETKNNYISVSNTGNSPVATFTAIPTSGKPPLTVNFADQSTNNPTNWFWDFGDGNTSNVQNPIHTYTVNGNYSVSLSVTNQYGSNTQTKESFIVVSNDNMSYMYCGNPTINYGFDDIFLDANGVLWAVLGHCWDGSGSGLFKLENNIWEPKQEFGVFARGFATLDVNEAGTSYIVSRDDCGIPENAGFGKFENEVWSSYNIPGTYYHGGEYLGKGTSVKAYDNIVWVGTSTDGIQVFDGNSFVENYSTNTSSIPSNNIQCISTIDGQTWWIGSVKGLGKYSNNQWITFDESNSILPDNDINCIFSINSNEIWVGSGKNLVHLVGTTMNIYNASNSILPNVDITYINSLDNNKIWISCGGSLYIFEDGNFEKFSPSEYGMPNVYRFQIISGNEFYYFDFNNLIKATINY